MEEKKQEKGKIYRFGNLILEYFPPIENESVAAYQLRTINNDARIEWDEFSNTFKWIEYFIKEKGNNKKAYGLFENMLYMYYNLACQWIPTQEGLTNIAKEYIEDVKRFGAAAKQVSPIETSEEEDQKIIEEERKNYDILHNADESIKEETT